MRHAEHTVAKGAEIAQFSGSRFANRRELRAIQYRRLVLELWAMSLLAVAIGFLGPFGTYADAPLAGRIGHWWLLLAGAYLLVRPTLSILRVLARRAALSVGWVEFWGVVTSSLPVTYLWRAVGRHAFRDLDFAGLLPFALLCALAVAGVARWAAGADRRLQREAPRNEPGSPAPGAAADTAPLIRSAELAARPVSPPEAALLRRLPATFRGGIIALQSEDHYVRVHGRRESVLLLMRLRDAIAEMGDVPGEQVHRSWWVARDGLVGWGAAGRGFTIQLANGAVAPIARDTVARLRGVGFLPPGKAADDEGLSAPDHR